MSVRADALPVTGSGRALVRILAWAVFLELLGASAIIPMLPAYIRHRGGSDALAGIVMGSFFLAGVLTQFPAGRLADRIGRRTVLVGGLLLYAFASLVFIVASGPAAEIATRFAQGVGAGATEVAALSMVAAVTPVAQRGRAVATVYSGQIGGMAIGPMVGALLGVEHMWIVFLGAAVTSSAACIPVLVSRPARDYARTDEGSAIARRPLPRLSRPLVGALIAACAFGATFGVYETCWTLYLDTRHATGFAVGLSWALFCVPFVVMARPGGWLADHRDRRLLAVGGLAVSLAMCATYPFVGAIPVLLVLSVIEAGGVAVALPSTQSLLTEPVGPADYGQVQGMFLTSQTAMTALSAAVAGILFAVAPAVPFVAMAAVCALLTAAAGLTWAPVRGRAGDGPGPDVRPWQR